ncbi:tetratricopeptide repeat protein [Vulcanococcus limneticus]|uniref:tetratricopeptide repeat protein n=1 Tax=Vulcanococcus limneticus TaxID=2170428 RepID=UPI0012FF9B61|nr:tetratricopeptide repeat protein [Vulcanococcus limneticus]
MLQDSPHHPQILDLLAFTLLMQGQYRFAERFLHRAITAGSRNFWTPHKLGDALRGLQRLDEAVQAYEQALLWGSDSPLTVRNLLHVLQMLGDAHVLERLQRFRGVGPLSWTDCLPWQQGAILAARNLGSPAMIQWLCRHGCPEPQIRCQAWCDSLASLDLVTTLEILDGCYVDDGEVFPAAAALRSRLQGLLASPLQQSEWMSGGQGGQQLGSASTS